jgi:hypothetical protein
MYRTTGPKGTLRVVVVMKIIVHEPDQCAHRALVSNGHVPLISCPSDLQELALAVHAIMSSTTSSPDRRKSLIPRPPPSSLRPSSPSPSTPTTPNANVHTAVTPHSVPLSPRRSTRSTPPPQKPRARDLLRKHYGLGVGPPPPLPGKAADSDPMNLGDAVS